MRWIVERNFAWLENFRRIAVDYEFYANTAETMVQIEFIALIINKYLN
ncbi:MAG: hypothetical protein ACRCUJ_03315 [Phocaeicola sp.]